MCVKSHCLGVYMLTYTRTCVGPRLMPISVLSIYLYTYVHLHIFALTHICADMCWAAIDAKSLPFKDSTVDAIVEKGIGLCLHVCVHACVCVCVLCVCVCERERERERGNHVCVRARIQGQCNVFSVAEIFRSRVRT